MLYCKEKLKAMATAPPSQPHVSAVNMINRTSCTVNNHFHTTKLRVPFNINAIKTCLLSCVLEVVFFSPL